MNLVNQTVVHKAFGEGTIVAYDGNYITVKFSEKESKFVSPDVFTTFLKCKDTKLQAELELAFVAKEEAKAQKAREERERALHEAEETKRRDEEDGNFILETTKKTSLNKSRNSKIHKNYGVIAEIEKTLRSVRPNYADEIVGINKIRATLSNGGKLKIEDHVKAMILSLLSNMQEWDKIEKNLADIKSVFCDYNIARLMRKSETDILNEIKALRCGNLSIKRQINHLKDNIRTLERIDREQGGLDHYYASTDKYVLVDKLSNPDSEYKLQDMQVALVCEYLKGVGISLVKPDRHVCRIIGRLGFSEKIPAGEIETLRICDEIAQHLNMSHALVDTILWQYGVEKKCGICGETPVCNRCGVSACPNRK